LVKFIIKGKHNKLSREEIRALFHATATILEYHNKHLESKTVEVNIIPKEGFKGRKTKTGTNVVGTAKLHRDPPLILMSNHQNFSNAATVIIHEMIHLYFWEEFGDEIEEKLTSTLTAKIKQDVIDMANVIVTNTYQRAAFIAHTKMSYRPDDEDFYDENQYHENHDDSHGEKYRKNKKRPISFLEAAEIVKRKKARENI